MNIIKKRLEHPKNQTLLVGLSIQESAVSRQVESAKARATTHCHKYDKNNLYWKIVDELIVKHDELVRSISKQTVALFSNSDKNDDCNEVSSFINQESSQKKESTQFKKDDNDVVIFDIEDSDDNGGDNNDARIMMVPPIIVPLIMVPPMMELRTMVHLMMKSLLLVGMTRKLRTMIPQ
jgi:hypothetical protein